MDRASLTTFFDALKSESIPPLVGADPSNEQISEAMRAVGFVEERLVDCVAVGVGFVQLGDEATATAAFGLADQWFEVWGSYQAHGIRWPFSSLQGNPFYEAARFALEHRPDRHEAAVRWMEWAQELNPRVDHFVDMHARLLLAVGRRDEAVEMVARHRGRYADAPDLAELYAQLGDALDSVELDYTADAERELIAKQIKLDTREYILGRSPQWPQHAHSYTPVFNALLAACVPNDHPMMLRLLSALGHRDGSWLSSFVQSYLHPLANVPEAVALALKFVEPAGFVGWELVTRAFPSGAGDHWIEGVWSYLDGFGPRESFVERGWEQVEQRRMQFAALLKPVDPDWTTRMQALIKTASSHAMRDLLPLMDDTEVHLVAAIEAWLQDRVGSKRTARIAAWLRGEAEFDDSLLVSLPRKRTHDDGFPGDPRSWRSLPDDAFFRRLTRLATEFEVNSVLVELERRQLDVSRIREVPDCISVVGQIEILLDRVESEERLELGAEYEEEAPDTEDWKLAPIRRAMGRALTELVSEHPEAARRAITRISQRLYGSGTELFLRGLQLLASVAPGVHRDWILQHSSPKPVREWVLEWIGDDPKALEWARERLEGKQRELALLVCARQLDGNSLTALQAGFAELPKQRWELGEALSVLDPDFTKRAAFEKRASQTSVTLLRKGQSLPMLKWAGGDALSATVSTHLQELIVRGVRQRREASALIAQLDSKSQQDLAHACYVGARPKFKTFLPELLVPFGDARLADALAADVLAIDTKVEHQDFVDRIRRAAELTELLVGMKATPQLVRLGGRVWADELRDVIFKHIRAEDTDRSPQTVDFAWLFGVWSAGAWWSPHEWPFEPTLARKLLWDDGTDLLVFDDQGGFRTLAGDERKPDQVRLAQTRPERVPKAVRSNPLKQNDVRETPDDPDLEFWSECEGHRVERAKMRGFLLRRGWRVGAIDREMICESFFWEVPRLGQGVELRFTYADAEQEYLRSVVFYRLGTAHRPRYFPKGDYLTTEFDEPPLKLGEVNPMLFHHAVAAVRAVMKAGTGFDPDWRNRY